MQRGGVGDQRRGVYLDFRDAIKRLGKKAVEDRYGKDRVAHIITFGKLMARAALRGRQPMA